MKKRTIFQQQSQELMQIYEEAGNSKKVLVVAMDYAKKEHTIMFCNGNGDILRKPFGAKNTPEGVNYLIEQVHKTCNYLLEKPAKVEQPWKQDIPQEPSIPEWR